MEAIRYPMVDGKGNIVNDTLTEYLLYQKKADRERTKYLLQKARRVKKCRAKKIRRAVAGLVMVPIAIQGIVSFACNGSLFKVSAKSKTSSHLSIQSVDNKANYNKKNVDMDNEQIFNETLSYTNVEDPFCVGSSDLLATISQFLNSDIGSYIFKYSDDYGVDPNIIAAICMQESSLEHERCSPGGDRYSGYGVGLMQLESPSGQEIQAYNYNTGMTDTLYITMDNACNIEKNIQIGCMIFQNSIINNKGNICLAIQSHNYGQGMLDSVLSRYSSEKGIGIDDIKSNCSDIGWLDYVLDAHYNPSKYIDGWQESQYGDGEYLYHVLRYNTSDVANYKYSDQDVAINLKTLKPVSKYI